MGFRIERDFLGERDVPEEAYWGIHTLRAKENFPISGYGVPQQLLKAMAIVKKACCLTNMELGYLEKRKAEAILLACDELIDGRLCKEFPIDAFQGGAGTSTNMNINEVIANRAIEILGGRKGDYSVIHPLNDVNLHQSTNDVYPTALKIACIFSLRELSQAIAALQGAFQKKEKEFAEVVKTGRTELQPAVPLTVGAEFSAFADAISRDRWRTFKCEERLRVVNIGGTAIGTGMGAPRDYIFLVVERLRELTGLGLSRGENLVDQTANADCFVEVSGILKAHASNLIKIANDLRLLNLLGEIRLPNVQVGSSIMPGKVNPVIMEACIQTAIRVLSNDFAIAECTSRGTFQICEFMPMLAFCILESLRILININRILAEHVDGIAVDKGRCGEYFDSNPIVATALIPYIGYDGVSKLLKEFFSSGEKNVREFLARKLGKELIENVFSPYNLVSLGVKKK